RRKLIEIRPQGIEPLADLRAEFSRTDSTAMPERLAWCRFGRLFDRAPHRACAPVQKGRRSDPTQIVQQQLDVAVGSVLLPDYECQHAAMRKRNDRTAHIIDVAPRSIRRPLNDVDQWLEMSLDAVTCLTDDEIGDRIDAGCEHV